MRLIFMGPPGAGKGTQSSLCAEEFDLVKLATGDMLRAEIRKQSQLGKEVEDILARGDLVSDDVIMSIISERLKEKDCENGFVLDGFPRTVAQARALDEIMAEQKHDIDAVVSLVVPRDELIRRFTGRRVAESSGRVYHIEYSPPKVTDQCDETGEPLSQRPDDKEDVVKNRLDVYEAQTAPVLAFYAQKGVVIEIDGQQSVQDVFKDILARLKK